MTGPAALESGQYYHIYNRGNDGANLFLEERNYLHFLRLYGHYIYPVADTYCYCLLRNHFHLLVRILTSEEQLLRGLTLGTSEAPAVPAKPKNASQQFGNLFNAYAKAINKCYGRTGSLFQNPFGRVRVTSEGYLVHLVAYIHQNPQRHRFVADFRYWPYSSYRTILARQPTRLQREEVLAWFQGPAAFRGAHDHLVNQARIAALVPEDLD
jgi:hypothetical protein